MIYLGIMVYSMATYCLMEKLNRNRVFVLGFLGLLWFLIMGFQYNPASDYVNYIEIYNGSPDLYADVKKEYAFWAILKLAHFLGSSQFIFIIISLFQVVLTFLVFEKYRKFGFTHLYLFIFVYFTMSGIFQNQLGFIRNFTAILLFNYALFAMYEKKIFRWCLLILLGGLFHNSCYFLFPLYFLRSIMLKEKSKKFYLFCVLFPLSSFFLKDYLYSTISHFVPIQYIYYLNIEAETPLLTKALLIPLYLLSILCVDFKKYSKNQIFFINLAFVFSNIHFFAYIMPIMSRFFQYGDLIRCLPVFLMLITLKNKRNTLLFIILVAYLIVPYVLKVTFFAVGPYKYDNIGFLLSRAIP